MSNVYVLNTWLGIPINVSVNGNHLTIRTARSRTIAYSDLDEVVVQRSVLRPVIKLIKKDGDIIKFYSHDIGQLYSIQDTINEKKNNFPFGMFPQNMAVV